MDTTWQVQPRQEAGELAARTGLTGRLGEICRWHRRRAPPAGAYLSGLPDLLVAALLIQELARESPAIRLRGEPVQAPPVPGPLPWTRPVNGTWP